MIGREPRLGGYWEAYAEDGDIKTPMLNMSQFIRCCLHSSIHPEDLLT